MGCAIWMGGFPLVRGRVAKETLSALSASQHAKPYLPSKQTPTYISGPSKLVLNRSTGSFNRIAESLVSSGD